MAFKLVALHVPSQEEIIYGPWPSSEDPVENSNRAAFAHGFICGVHSVGAADGKPEDLAFTIVEVPDEEPEPPTNVVAVLVAEASATVTHPDGTTD